MTIIVYGTPTCSQCKMFKEKLKENDIDFNSSDDLETLLDLSEKTRIMSAPIVKIEDEFFDIMGAFKKIGLC